MAYKSLRCPNCSAQIDTIDESTKRAFCPYCDAVIEDVQEQQKDFEITIKEPIKVEGLETRDQQFHRIQDFIKLGKNDRAVSLLLEYTDRYPLDFKGWAQLYQLEEKDLENNNNSDDFNFGTVAAGSTLDYLNNSVKTSNSADDRRFLDSEKERLEHLKAQYSKQLEPLSKELSAAEGDRNLSNKELEEKRKVYDRANQNKKSAEKSEEDSRSRDGFLSGLVLAAVCAIGGAWLIGGAAGFGWGILAFFAGGAIGLFIPTIIATSMQSSAKESVKHATELSNKAWNEVSEARDKVDSDTSKINEIKKEINDINRKIKHVDLALKVLDGKAPTNNKGNIEQDYSVVLQDFGDNKIGVIVAYREITGASLEEAKAAIESDNPVVKSGLSKDEARDIASKLNLAGGTTTII